MTPNQAILWLPVCSFQRSAHVYEVRPRKDHRGADLVSDVLPFGRLWYDGPEAVTNAIGCDSRLR
jgi:hypothetical protein